MFLPVLLGAAIVLILGVVHGIYTLRSSPSGGPMTPTDPAVREAMSRTGGLGLAPTLDTPLWRAWVGFNLSHSLGVVAVALFVGIPTLVDFDAALDRWWWVAIALAAPPLYLAISIRYWFREPTIGIAAATALLAVGILGGLLT